MKRIKRILLALLVLFAFATVTSGCYHGKVCQAQKVGNHR